MKNNKRFKRSLFFVTMIGTLCLTGLTNTAKAWDDDYDGDRYREYECRDVVKKIRISRSLTHTERGTACRSPYGSWEMTTGTRYPGYEAKVFFREHGRLIFAGYVQLRDDDFDDWRDDDHDVDFAYNEKPKCKKKHKNHRHEGHWRHDYDEKYIKYTNNYFFD